MGEESSSCRDFHDDSSNGIPHSMIDDSDGFLLIKDSTIKNSLRKDSSDCGNLLQNDDQFTSTAKQNYDEKALITSVLLPGSRLHPHRPHFFSAKELSSSIIASETTRNIFSVLIALLVVLSYIDSPLLGINIVNSKSIVAMRPLYMLLVTEITVLVTHLVLQRRRRIEDFEEDDDRALKEGELNWERAVSVLERGIVAHQAARAVFIDFSVYVVIAVCGLSLV